MSRWHLVQSGSWWEGTRARIARSAFVPRGREPAPAELEHVARAPLRLTVTNPVVRTKGLRDGACAGPAEAEDRPPLQDPFPIRVMDPVLRAHGSR